MSCRLFGLGFRVWLALLASVAVCHAQTDGKTTHGRELELTEPMAKEAITNLNQLSGHSSLRQLEDDLTKSLQPLAPKGSLDGVMAPQYLPPPPRQIIRSQKLKDELEKRQNWMFLSPDDLLPGVDDADLLKLQDATDATGKKKSPLEQFYDRLERERKGGTKSKLVSDDDPLSTKDPFHDDSESMDDSKLPGGVRDSAQNLRKLLNQQNGLGTYGEADGRGSLSDLFGLGVNKLPTKEEIEKHKAYMDEFRKLLDGPTPVPGSMPSAGSAFDPFKAANAVGTTPGANVNGLLVPTPHIGTESTFGTLGTIPNPTFIPDANATVLNQWNPYYNPQIKVDPPKPASINVPMPEAPRRRF